MEGREIIKWGFIVLGVTIVIGYSCFVLYDFVRGPQIIISNPQNGFSTTTPVIEVSGRAIHANNITINDNLTSVNLAGIFDTQLILAPGYNIIKVTAKDNYGRTENKTIETVLVESGISNLGFGMGTTTSRIILEKATSTINNF